MWTLLLTTAHMGGGVEIGFLRVGCPVTHSVNQASLEFTEISLPLSPECWD